MNQLKQHTYTQTPYRCRAKLDDGAYVSYGKSINHDKCLSDSNYVRAALHHVAAIYRYLLLHKL